MSVHVSFVLNPEDIFEAQPPHRYDYGDRHMIASTHLDGRGYGHTGIQGRPAELRRLAAELRRLAAELLGAAAAAEQWDVDHPIEATDG